MGKRYVDADILEDLSRHARSTRDDVHDLLGKCAGRVKSLPQRGWNPGTWGDVFNSVKNEVTSLDDHARELVNTAGRVREVARERALRELRELWTAIAGLKDKIESEAGWLKSFWEKWERRAKSVMSRLLVLAVLATLPSPIAVGIVVVALSPAWIEALRRLDEAGKQEASPVSDETQTKPEGPLTITTEIKAESYEQWVERKTEKFRGDHPETVPVTYPGTGGCVALVMRYASEALNAPLGKYWHGGPNGEWANRQAFGPEWERIEPGALRGYQVGDIVFFEGFSAEGHVGIVISVSPDGGTVEIMDQAYKGQAVDIRTYSVSEGNHSDLYCQKENVHHYTKGVMRLTPPA
jgi:hypothetical protein